MANQLTSTDMNILVYRYLMESGFHHAAFTFGYEAFVHKNGVTELAVPPAALINFVQKGLQYLELETNLREDGTIEGDYSCLTSQELLTKSSEDLRDLIQERREKREQQRKAWEERLAQGGEAGPLEIPESKVRVLQGHAAEVYSCSWNPVYNLIASGAGDRTARIWDLSLRSSNSIELHHPLDKERDVTTLDWSPDGALLATGSYDGQARIWTKEGVSQNTLTGHTAPIFSLKWNKKGDLLLSGSIDKTAIVWTAKGGHLKQRFSFHLAPALDVDWQNDDTFATSSSDRTIQVCRVGEETPLKVFRGHVDEVNSIKWDPQGKLLVSCSDDKTAKVWSMDQDDCVYDLTEHLKEIYSVKWSPTGLGTANPNQPPMLATASFDSTIRFWEMETGSCTNTMLAHDQAVYTIAFSPDGNFLASGSFDKKVKIWAVHDGSLVRSFDASGGIFEVSWSKDGDFLAACSTDRLLTILDLRM